MLKIIKKDKVDYSVQYKIDNKLKLNKKDKKWLDKNLNPEIAYRLAYIKCNLYNIKKYEEEVCKDPCYAYLFARDVKGANIEKCQEAACKDSWYAYYFAKNIKGANIEKCQEAACKDPELVYYFARFIPGANIEKCQKAVKQKFSMGISLY